MTLRDIVIRVLHETSVPKSERGQRDLIRGILREEFIVEGRKAKTTEEFISDAIKVHGDEYTYDKVDYQLAQKKVIITCPIHGDFLITPNNFLKGSGCRKCSESKGENYISELLNDFGVKFISEKKFEGCVGLLKKEKCYQLKFDFYLPEYNMVIEFDGEQHFKSIDRFKRDLNESELYDKIKNDYCKDNNIKLVRIPYTYPLPTSPRFNQYDDLSSYKGGGNKKYPFIEPYLRDVLGIS